MTDDKAIWSEEQKERFRQAHDVAVCEAQRQAYKDLCPEAFMKKKLERNTIFFNGGGHERRHPCLLIQDQNGEYHSIFFDGCSSIGPHELSWWDNWQNKVMRSGTIALTVKDGKIAGCKVEEDE